MLYKFGRYVIMTTAIFGLEFSDNLMTWKVQYWGNKEWLAVHYGEFEEARGWVILNNARAERVNHRIDSVTFFLFWI